MYVIRIELLDCKEIKFDLLNRRYRWLIYRTRRYRWLIIVRQIGHWTKYFIKRFIISAILTSI